ncbi:uncharacterized protein B0I36DRAFT_397410 [Microdochium trichocladiopsis]|uniref:Uncharacterized protein n=1 Tax=Microdochium trichocladiopsis TaxID=1682393 RepID=A0A9P9BLH7_9PEZI|nr:uncharacterized protein B0I36DRAFT_397410 [Microdochium trichocladiopsis]KAH7014102.1 hypothetical protein B0I36DRAFT_397410 [Microdochium trichocladiopsis]
MFRHLKKRKPLAPPEVFGYDRDVLVALVRRHYDLLVVMGHLHPAALQAPLEPDGWSDAQLNVDALRALGRSEVVIDLLRHLPYPRAGSGRRADASVHYETKVLSYLRNTWKPDEMPQEWWDKQSWAMLRLAPFDKALPPHMISLTYDEAAIGCIWIIDTEIGCVYPHGDDYYLYDDAPREAESQKLWLRAKPVSFTTFFNSMHEQITRLKIIPCPAAGKHRAAMCKPGDTGAKVVRQLYREYGWPKQFNKDGFRRAAVPARQAALSEEPDWSGA